MAGMGTDSLTSFIKVQTRLLFRVSDDDDTVTATSHDHLGGTALTDDSRGKGVRVLALDRRLDGGLLPVNLISMVRRVVLVGFHDVIVSRDQVVLSESVAADHITAGVDLADKGLDTRLGQCLETVVLDCCGELVAFDQVVAQNCQSHQFALMLVVAERHNIAVTLDLSVDIIGIFGFLRHDKEGV